MTSTQASTQPGPGVAPGISLALPKTMRYFIVRPDNTMVPLVPADQLPFQVAEVPRQITHEQMSKEGWKWLLNTTQPKSQLSVQAPASCEPAKAIPAQLPPRSLAPDHEVRATSTKESYVLSDSVKPTLSATEIASKPRSFDKAKPAPLTDFAFKPPTIVAREVDPNPHPNIRTAFKPSAILTRDNGQQPGVAYLKAVEPSLAKSIATSYPKDTQRVGYPFRKANPSGIEPDLSKKVYCTYWIKTGECNWAAIGCRFKHEMPSKLEDLQTLGFREWPKWWKEENAKLRRGPTWMQRAVNQRNNGEEPTQSELKPILPHANKAHALFNRISKDSNREMLKDSQGDHPRSIFSFDDHEEDLLDLHATTPVPSRQNSVSSNSSSSSKGYDAASSMSSAGSVQSEYISNAAAKSSKKPLADDTSPVSATIVEGKQCLRLPAKGLRDVDPTDAQSPAQPSAPKAASAPASSKIFRFKESKAAEETGMARSRFAGKPATESSIMEANDKSASKPKSQKRSGAKPARATRREKKHRSSTPEKAVLTDSLI